MKQVESSSPLLLKYLNIYEKDPKSKVFAPLAEVYRRLGMLDEALSILKKGIKLNPLYLMGHIVLADCYMDMREFNLVYSTLKPFISANRDNIRMQKIFARACMELGNSDEALSTYKYLLFINPKDVEVAEQVQFLEEKRNITASYVEIDDNDNEIKPSLLFNLDQIGIAPEQVDDSQLVDEWIQVDLSSGTIEAETEIPQLHRQADEFDWNYLNSTQVASSSTEENFLDHAQVDISDITSGNQDNNFPVITHTLVDLYCEQGYIDKAIEILEKILLLNPNDERTKKKLIQIKQLTMESDQSLEGEVTRDLEEKTEDEGRNLLMSYFDKKLLNRKNERVKEIEERLGSFLERLNRRADLCLSKDHKHKTKE